MSTVADKLTALHGIKADLFAATREKGLDTTGRTLENLHELWGGISGGGALQAKTAVPSNVDVEVTPDDGYDALSAVTIAAALNLKPWNIRKGKTLFGVTGTADIAVTTEVPSDIPVSKEDADTAYEEAVGSAPKDEGGNDLDMMTLADDNGNITYGYFLQGAANGSANGTCLYNGVELPDINTVWTDEVKETHPYATIIKCDYTDLGVGVITVFTASSMPYLYISDGRWESGPSNKYSIYYLSENSASWADDKTGDNGPDGSNTVTSNDVIWTSHDLLNADGTVYLAASDPIPLDYNTIIRWDGNTEGLEVTPGGYYRVADYVPAESGILVVSIGTEVAVSNEFSYADGTGQFPQLAGFWAAALDGTAVAAGYPFELEGNSPGIYIIGAGEESYTLYLKTPVTASPSGFTITSYDPITTNFSAVGWRRLSYHTTGELAGQWTYDDFSTTASSGGNFLKNIIQCSREKLYYNGAEVWPNPDQSAITTKEVTT